MTVSPERIAANKANAQKSTGPKTEAGKEASRANGTKHGLTGEGIVMAEAEAAEVDEIARRLRSDYRPITEVGGFLLDRMAMFTVRLRRCAVEERVRLAAMNDGEGGLFDPSTEGQRAFRYENAAERNYHKAFKEFQRVEAEARGMEVVAKPTPATVSRPMASSCQEQTSPPPPIKPSEPSVQPRPRPNATLLPNSPMFTSNLIPISAAAPQKRPT